MTLLPLNRGFSFICSLLLTMANSIEVLPVIQWRDPAPTQATINAKAVVKQQNAFQASPLVSLFLGLCLCAPALYGLGTAAYNLTVPSLSIEYRQ